MGGMNRQHEQKKNLYFGLFDSSGNEQGPENPRLRIPFSDKLIDWKSLLQVRCLTKNEAGKSWGT